ncbi:hypothetical protein ACJRO7_019226 [Eucalyptus globulus]|uniref:Protein kinase domain-containing protein n=1 Tax=Eucalyptus globulus TaxID=34317 RepID=A0ABD3KE78_EUCGL
MILLRSRSSSQRRLVRSWTRIGLPFPPLHRPLRQASLSDLSIRRWRFPFGGSVAPRVAREKIGDGGLGPPVVASRELSLMSVSLQPLSDACSFGHEDICKILMARGGKDPVGLDAQNPCYEIDCNEIDMEGAILIGEGVFGEVYMVKWRGTEVSSKNNTSDFMKELALWQKLRHPNIVQFLGVLKQSDRLIFLTEYLRNGSLFDILRKRGRLDPQTAVAYALDIARFYLGHLIMLVFNPINSFTICFQCLP